MNISLIGIFLEGLLSFLSPCVLPLLPLYMSYLAGDNKVEDEDGNVKYNSFKVFITTLFFVLGICLTLCLFSLSVNVVKEYINDYKEIVSIICGTILIIFGLHEIGIKHINVLDSDKRIISKIDTNNMSLLKAFLLGFVFSLGWSPCIGPMLTNALMLAMTEVSGYLYIVAYGLGLVIPFLITGLLTSQILNLLNNKKKVFKYVMIIAGIIMICYGGYMIINGSRQIVATKQKTNNPDAYLYNYEFIDQDGNAIKLSDYKDKYIMVNFVTTWCTYCKQEIPEYLEFSSNHEDEVVCLYVMSTLSSGTSLDNILEFIDENFALKVIIDEDNIMNNYCPVSGYPTVYVISPVGKVLGYCSGMVNVSGFEAILEQAKNQFNNR